MTYVRWLLLAGGVTLFTFLLNRVGLNALFTQASKMGWSFLLILVVYTGYHTIRTLSWEYCLRLSGEHLRLAEGARLWLAGEAVSYLSFQLSGDAFRAAVLRKRIPLSKGLSAILINRAIYTYAALFILAAGFTTGFFILPGGTLRAVAGGGAVLVALALAFPFVWGSSAFGFLRSVNRRFENRPSGSIIGKVHRFFRQLGDSFLRVIHTDRAAFARLLLLNLLASMVGVIEIYLLLRSLDPDVPLKVALVVEAGSKLIALTGHIIPGNIGVREAGMSLLLQPFGFPPAAGIALALLRRGRQIFWVTLGGGIMFYYGLRPSAADDVNVAAAQTAEE